MLATAQSELHFVAGQAKDLVPADGRVLGVIDGFLKAEVMEGKESREPDHGTPHGGVISPLLANIYLDRLDWPMVENELETVRYADDMVVLCRDREKARGALEKIREWMAKTIL